MKFMKLLNIAAGKMPYLPDIVGDSKSLFVVNLDTMYYNHTLTETIEQTYHQINDIQIYDETSNINAYNQNRVFYCKEDVFQFLERTQMEFDVVTIYRFLEHVSFTQILYFIYLVSGVVHKGGIVDVIVPNYKILASMLIQEHPKSKSFEQDNILLTTELLNEPSCPHVSIWTPERAKYFWELEKRFFVASANTKSRFEYDGRDIYLRFQAERI